MALSLAAPGWLLLLPFVWTWTCRSRNAPAAAGPRLFLPDLLGLDAAPSRPDKAPWVRALAFSLMVLALARPQSEGQLIPQAPPAREIMLLVDSSPSMSVTIYERNGVSVSRLDVIKHSIARLMAARPYDDFALVAFGDHAATLVPMTSDHRLVQSQLQRLTPGFAGRGTAIGEALGLGIRRLQAHEGPRPLLLLFSDGENTAGSLMPAEALALARHKGLAFYTIGVGANTPATDGPGLRELALLTGGTYYPATDSAAANHLVHALDHAQPGVPPRAVRGRREWYGWLIAGAALLMALASALREKWGP